MKLLDGKVAVVTGAARGIGKAIALEFAKEGANVAFTDLAIDENGKATEAEIAALGVKAKGYASNAANFEETHAVIDQIIKDFGRIDILVNNAGVTLMQDIFEIGDKDWDFILGVNVKGLFRMTQLFADGLRRAGKGGNVVNLSSNGAKVTYDDQVHYCASKAAVSNMTQCMASNFAPLGINVNAVCPGNFYEGPLWSNPENGLFLQYLHAGKVPGAKTVEDVRKYYMDQVPMRKGTGPEDVTKAVLYLIEQTCETGQAVPVTGGQVMLS